MDHFRISRKGKACAYFCAVPYDSIQVLVQNRYALGCIVDGAVLPEAAREAVLSVASIVRSVQLAPLSTEYWYLAILLETCVPQTVKRTSPSVSHSLERYLQEKAA